MYPAARAAWSSNQGGTSRAGVREGRVVALPFFKGAPIRNSGDTLVEFCRDLANSGETPVKFR